MTTVRSARDMVISTVGRRLYETFFEGYTRKQWGSTRPISTSR